MDERMGGRKSYPVAYFCGWRRERVLELSAMNFSGELISYLLLYIYLLTIHPHNIMYTYARDQQNNYFVGLKIKITPT